MARGLTRRNLLGVGAAISLPGVGCLGAQRPGLVTVDEPFEQGLDDWDRDADVPEHPETGMPVEWSIELSTERARSGERSARFVLDGSQDDGTIWLVRPVTVKAGTAYSGDLTVRAWSASESFNTLANLVCLTTTARPTVEDDFPPSGDVWTGEGRSTAGLRQPLNRREGWDEYSVSWSTPPLDTDRLWLAVGISVVWETTIRYFVDDVALRLRPI